MGRRKRGPQPAKGRGVNNEGAKVQQQEQEQRAPGDAAAAATPSPERAQPAQTPSTRLLARSGLRPQPLSLSATVSKLPPLAPSAAHTSLSCVTHPPAHLHPSPLSQPNTTYSPPSSEGTPVLFSTRKRALGESLDALPSGGGGAPAATPPPPPDDSVKVVVRIRPPSEREGGGVCVRHTSAETLSVQTTEEAVNFTFDHVAGPRGSQESMFKVVGRPCVENVLAGYNSAVLACKWVGQWPVGWQGGGGGGETTRCGPTDVRPCLPAHPPCPPCLTDGQTGSGKTFTMLGELPAEAAPGGAVAAPLPEQAGLIPRVFQHLFARIQELESARRASREVKFLCKARAIGRPGRREADS